MRLDDLIAATTLDYMRKLPGRFHGLSGYRISQFSVELDGGCRLVFEPANNPVPTHRDQNLDLSGVTAIRVVYVGDYHG
jgi:proteic killer suppression protein